MKKENKRGGKGFWIALVLALAALYVISTCFFIVDETQHAIVYQFGDPVQVINSSGLYLKLPDPLNSVMFFEKRLMVSESSLSEILTSDKKNLVIDYYVLWEITDPLSFSKKAIDTNGAKFRINDIVYSELRNDLGKYELAQIINPKRDEIHTSVTSSSKDKLSHYGINIIDVRVRRLNFPEQNKYHVFERMRSERSQMANLYRSEGEEQSLKIRSEADLEKTLILSNARRNASRIMALADEKAALIYNKAYGKDPQFYDFLKSMSVYSNVLSQGDKTVILSTDSEAFKHLG